MLNLDFVSGTFVRTFYVVRTIAKVYCLRTAPWYTQRHVICCAVESLLAGRVPFVDRSRIFFKHRVKLNHKTPKIAPFQDFHHAMTCNIFLFDSGRMSPSFFPRVALWAVGPWTGGVTFFNDKHTGKNQFNYHAPLIIYDALPCQSPPEIVA